MAYIPPISNYKPYYIQAAGDSTATDTATWGLVAMSNPFPALPDAKEPYINDWPDENGDDEYNAVMYYKPTEFSVKFYVKTFATQNDSAVKVLHTQIDSFFNKVKIGEFKIYDSYTGIGRKKVRFVGFEKNNYTASDNWARLIFTAKFKCNDPITRMKFSNNAIVEA